MIQSGRFRNALSLPASLVLGGLMLLMLAFFFLYNARGLSLPAAALLTVASGAAFWRLLVTGQTGKYRRLMFVAGALFFFPSFIANLLEARGSMFLTASDIFATETPFCHIVLPMTILPYLLEGVLIFPAQLSNHYAAFYPMLLIWLVATFTLGRGWCSWVCFYGGWDEGLAALPRKAMLPVKDPDKKIRYFNFSMLLFVALAALATFTAVYCAWLCPFKLITEFDQVTNGPSLIAFVLLVLTFFGFVVVLPLLTKKRAQCMSFCPFGAFQSLADKLSLYRVRIDPTLCNGCQACLRVCPTLSIHEDCLSGGQHQAQGKVLLTCTKCGLCMAACSRQAIRYEFTWQPCTPRPGRFEPTIARLRSGKRLARALAAGLSLTVELSDPKALLPFSGWLFGCIIMGGFAVNTVTRLLNLVLHGSFLFN